MTMTARPDALATALTQLPTRYPGPGGAAAVIHEGRIIARHSWGFANAETRRPFTPSTLFRMCSITKQFTCAVMLEAFPDPAVLNAAIAARLPKLSVPAPTALHLAHNQSGLRDYWAIAMLHGAPTESVFGDTEAARVIAGTQSLHFSPGTSYSYVNQNFRLLSDCMEEVSGKSFATLLREHIFSRYGMETAFLAADARAMPDGTDGYEGTEATGYRRAENNIYWTGDAGLGASLDDMIAWEKAIDAGRDDPASLYNRLTAPVTFDDGTAARYGFGLMRSVWQGDAVTGHGGALRGWRSHRMHVASQRLSVVVMFNHMSDAASAAAELAQAALALQPETDRADHIPAPEMDDAPPSETTFPGTYLEETTGLALRVRRENDRLRLDYIYAPEFITETSPRAAGRSATRLELRADALWMTRPQENRESLLRKLPETPPHPDAAGLYHCAELAADLTVLNTGGALYGAFSGMLGQGRMERLQPLGDDVWLLPCLRALDHAPPGHWTLAFHRAENGTITGARIGCWLARNLSFRRI